MTRYTRAEREGAALICAIAASTQPCSWYDAVAQLAIMGRRKSHNIRRLAHRASWRAVGNRPEFESLPAVYAEAEALIRNNEI